MGELVDLKAKIKKYFKFSPTEVRSIIISIVVLAFIISFADWGPGEEVDLWYGFINLINAILIVTLSLLVHLSVKKIFALQMNYRAEYNLWTFGLLACLVLAFVSTALFKNTWWVLASGGIMLQHIAGHRLGHFRYDINYYEAGWISITGPIANIVLAIIFKGLSAFVYNSLIAKAITFNLLFALYNALPIPPLDGSRMFYGTRLGYVMTFTFIVAAVILLWVDIPIWIALAGSALLALIGWLIYYIFIEQGFWRGPYP